MYTASIGAPVPMAASGVVKNTSGALLGFLCTTSGNIQLYDGLSTAGTQMLPGTLTVTAGSYVPIPVGFGTGLYATLGGSAQGTFVIG
jgi:hypothetical protein